MYYREKPVLSWHIRLTGEDYFPKFDVKAFCISNELLNL